MFAYMFVDTYMFVLRATEPKALQLKYERLKIIELYGSSPESTTFFPARAHLLKVMQWYEVSCQQWTLICRCLSSIYIWMLSRFSMVIFFIYLYMLFQ
jgi:hypothetical protein